MKKPFLHAVSALLYIVLIVNIINYFGRENVPENTILAPIAMLSLLVLSVTFMAFVFFYEPVKIYSEGNKKEALDFFAKTLGSFAFLVVLFGVLYLILR